MTDRIFCRTLLNKIKLIDSFKWYESCFCCHKEVLIMVSLNVIQLQGFVSKSIGVIANEARKIVSDICLGIDDIRFFGNKAIVLRAEITLENLPRLYTDLAFIGIKFSKESLPDIKMLKKEIEYSLSIQVVSLSSDTDRRVNIPSISG
jgi:hypothetical protein